MKYKFQEGFMTTTFRENHATEDAPFKRLSLPLMRGSQ
jgi:hypothetical protein